MIIYGGFFNRHFVLTECIQDYEQLQGRLYSNNAETCQMTIRVPENYTIALYFHNSYFFGGGCDKGALKVGLLKGVFE